MTAGVDYAFSSPDPAGLYAAGVRFAGRYLGAGTADKRLTLDEATQLSHAGVACVSLVEGRTTDPLGGVNVGHDHATAALREGQSIGMPGGRPYYFAVDWDVQLSEWPAVSAYLSGAASVVGWANVGVYGGLRCMRLAHDTTPVRWLFQTYAWSGGIWHPAAQLRQVHNGVQLAGGTVDLCQGLTVDYGQWMLTDPSELIQGDTMYLIKENSNTTVWLSNGIVRRSFSDMAVVDGLIQAGLVAKPVGDVPTEHYGWIMTVGVGQLDAYAGRPDTELVDQAGIQASAATGAAAGIRAAIGDGSQVAQELSTAVAAQLGTLTGSLTLSGSLSGRVGSSS